MKFVIQFLNFLFLVNENKGEAENSIMEIVRNTKLDVKNAKTTTNDTKNGCKC
jgi:hypothetical protein